MDEFSSVAPGSYEVRLTVDGKSWTQPLKVIMDPRSPATSQDLEQQVKLGRQIFAAILQCRRVLAEINSAQKQLSALQPKLTQHADLKASTTEVTMELQKILGDAAGAPSAMGLEKANTGLASALRVVESGDRTVPAQALEVYQVSSEAMKLGLSAWDKFKTNRLPELNQQLQQANFSPIEIKDFSRLIRLDLP